MENKLYEAHSYSLRLYSKVFREIFEKEGGVGTKEQPIPLEGVTGREFEALISQLSKLFVSDPIALATPLTTPLMTQIRPTTGPEIQES